MAEANYSYENFDEDEIDSLTKRNIHSRQKIKKLKEWTIKNMVYTNVEIPNNWKQKLDYRDIMFSTINRDKLFFDFLSQQAKNSADDNINSKTKKKVNNGDESMISTDDKASTGRRKTNLINMLKTTNNFNLQSNSSSNSVFSNVLFKTGQIKNLTTSNYFRKPAKAGDFDNLERIAIKKRLEIKTFYKTDNLAKIKKSISIAPTKKHVVKTNSQYGPFLNIVTNTKKIEIKNKDVKNLVEECNNFGPFYSHCPSCNNRNLSFYQNMNSENAMKLLTFIRDNRLKSSNK